jgi:hypothetical protein
MTTSCRGLLLPVAQAEHWQRMGDAFRHTSPPWRLEDCAPYMLAACLAGIVGLVFAWVLRRNDHTARCDDPEKLFRELCQAHELTGEQRLLLRELAAEVCPRQPAAIFLAPQCFAPPTLPPSLADNHAALRELREQLFA